VQSILSVAHIESVHSEIIMAKSQLESGYDEETFERQSLELETSPGTSRLLHHRRNPLRKSQAIARKLDSILVPFLALLSMLTLLDRGCKSRSWK
jgi:hypothetical protein